MTAATSREKVDVVRRLYEAAACRDAGTVLSLYDPEVELDGSRSRWAEVMSGPARWRGHEELRAFFRAYHEMWQDLQHDVREMIDTGDEVLCVVDTRGRGRASGVEVVWEGHAGVWTVRDGKVVRVVWFASREDAFEALGSSVLPWARTRGR